MKDPSRPEPLRTRFHAIMENTAEDDRLTRFIHIFLPIVIITNTIAVIIYTIPSVETSHSPILNLILTFCLLVFALEYLLRLWSCTNAETLGERMKDRFRYATGFFMIIDLLSIVPLAFPFFFAADSALLRVFRLISIFKLGRYAQKSTSLALLQRVIFKKKEIFSLMIFFLVFVILFSSTIMYLVENGAQPEKFSSIPSAIWWAMMTVTTVGYGDIIPVTPLGKTIGSFITLAGVLLLALPSAILASGFIEERQRDHGTGPKAADEQADSPEEMVSLLERAARLKEDGHITGEEYAAIKSTVLGEKR